MLTLAGCSASQYIQQPSYGENDAQQSLPTNVRMNIKGTSYPRGETPSDFYDQEVNAAISRKLSSWSQDLNRPLMPVMNYQLEQVDSGVVYWRVFTSWITYWLWPFPEENEYRSSIEIQLAGETIYSEKLREDVKVYRSIWPTPAFYGDLDLASWIGKQGGYEEMVNENLNRHKTKLLGWMSEQHNDYLSATKDADLETKRNWLSDNRNNIFKPELLEILALEAPRGNARGWHHETLDLFPEYLAFIPQDYQVWFVGPAGNRTLDVLNRVNNGGDVAIMASRLKLSGATYSMFSDQEVTVLKEGGLPSVLIAAMLESGAYRNGAAKTNTVAVSGQTAQNKSSASYAIFDNTGEFLCPWTTDDVLAEWVDKSINASIGSSVGATVGAYAGQRLLGSIPFVGGWLGSKVGNETGRMIAIEASGGEAYIRETSDISFRTLEDMARYIQANYITSSHYQDGINAANQIYPDLMEAMASVY